MEKVGIILSARTDSERLPNKILLPLKGELTCFEFQLLNLKKSRYPVVVAVPYKDSKKNILEQICKKHNIPFYSNPDIDEEDVLGRFVACAKHFGFDHVGRITHDDIFFDHELFEAMVEWHLKNNADHTNCPQAPRGIDSEVIRVNALEIAESHTRHLKHREHITYYVKRPPFKFIEMPLDFRVALDYMEDYEVIKKVAESLGDECLADELRKIFLKNPQLIHANRLPRVSVSICCKDYGRFLEKAIGSALNQSLQDIELVLLDDGSKDNTWEIMCKYDKVKKFRNEQSVGLIKASQYISGFCRGEYIMRLDADDWLEPNALEIMANWLDRNRAYNAVFSDFKIFWENSNTYQLVKADSLKMPHPACALIRRHAWNDIKVNEGLTCRDGWDFWIKFRQRFLVGYIPEPLWNYRKHGDSLSQKKESLDIEADICINSLKDILEKREKEFNSNDDKREGLTNEEN
jgi:spore coat polysaccharide biosynthesis protein SpsF (cytidylyltransferase family)